MRAEVNLQDVKSISCACVCRILPENEEEYIAAKEKDRSNITSIFATPEEFDESASYEGPEFNGFGYYPGSCDDEDDVAYVPVKYHMMVTPSRDNLCIETDKGHKIEDNDENIYQFVTPRGASESCRIDEDSGQGDVQMQYEFDPYTQIWLCGRDQRKGLLQIFTYNDNNVGQYVSD